jgi:hypothetical protein
VAAIIVAVACAGAVMYSDATAQPGSEYSCTISGGSGITLNSGPSSYQDTLDVVCDGIDSSGGPWAYSGQAAIVGTHDFGPASCSAPAPKITLTGTLTMDGAVKRSVIEVQANGSGTIALYADAQAQAEARVEAGGSISGVFSRQRRDEAPMPQPTFCQGEGLLVYDPRGGEFAPADDNYCNASLGNVDDPVCPPETTISEAPPEATNSRTATFEFTSSEDLSTFQCRLDSVNWQPCSSPKSYANLADMNHLFEVRAIDATFDSDPTPARHIWQVDTIPPETTIDSGPSGPTNNASPSFSFSANEPNVTFECRLDAGAWGSCTSPKAYTNLSQGPHTFDVRATDAAGNLEPTPASRSFTVDTQAPETFIDGGPHGGQDATFWFSSNEGGARFECSVDGGPFEPCSSPHTYPGIGAGP